MPSRRSRLRIRSGWSLPWRWTENPASLGATLPRGGAFGLMAATQCRKCSRVPFFDRARGAGALVAVEAAETGETLPVLCCQACGGRRKFLLQRGITFQARAQHSAVSRRSSFHRIFCSAPRSFESPWLASRRGVVRRHRPDRTTTQQVAAEPEILRHFVSAGTGGGVWPGPAIVEIVPIVERCALPPLHMAARRGPDLSVR